MGPVLNLGLKFLLFPNLVYGPGKHVVAEVKDMDERRAKGPG